MRKGLEEAARRSEGTEGWTIDGRMVRFTEKKWRSLGLMLIVV